MVLFLHCYLKSIDNFALPADLLAHGGPLPAAVLGGRHVRRRHHRGRAPRRQASDASSAGALLDRARPATDRTHVPAGTTRCYFTIRLSQCVDACSCVQTLQASVGVRGKVSVSQGASTMDKIYLNLQLACACLEYLSHHAEKLISVRKPLETADMVSCLLKVIRCMLLC